MCRCSRTRRLKPQLLIFHWVWRPQRLTRAPIAQSASVSTFDSGARRREKRLDHSRGTQQYGLPPSLLRRGARAV